MADSLLDTRFRNFPVPSLDDRQFDDLMEELLALIPVYCPEWSWHSPADPGITLLELFAYLTDVMLYRVNYMPVRNLFAVLNLLGIQPLPPASARTQLVVEPNALAHGQLLRAGTAVSALLPSSNTGSDTIGLDADSPTADQPDADDDSPVIFETEADLLLSNAQLRYVLTASGQSTRDLSQWLETRAEPFHPFAGTQGLERFLYFCDARFLTLREPGMRVHLRFEGPSGHRDLYARWSWQYFDGEGWARVPLAVSHEAGEVVLMSIPDLAERALPVSAPETPSGQGSSTPAPIAAHTGPWLRAAPLPGEEEPSHIAFRDLLVEVESVDEGVLPTALFLNQGDSFASLDVTRTFYPLGENPQHEHTLYLLARELFRAAGTRVELHFVTPPAERSPRPDPSPDLELALEYGLPGGRWGLLRTLTPNPFVQSSDARHQVSDETRALKRGGVIAFKVPEDLTARVVQGIEGPWIRLRLVQGHYRAPLGGLDDGTPFPTAIPGLRPFTGAPTPVAGPMFQALFLRSKAPASSVQHCISYSDFTWMELWNVDRPRGTTVAPFPLREAYTTALYLGFSQAFPAGQQRLFVKVSPPDESYDAPFEQAIARQQVRWEVATQTGFVPLPQLDDQTLHLKRDGYVSFQARADWPLTALFEREALWLRARLMAGRYDQAPLIEDIRTNVVNVLHGETWREDRFLPSDGQPYQEIQLLRAPVLEPVRVWVREREPLRAGADLRPLLATLGASLKADGDIRQEDGNPEQPLNDLLRTDADGVWTRWRRVDQLGLAGPHERCFALDVHQGLLRFGDGRHGRVPPIGSRIIHIESYRIGGGVRGNVAAHALQTLRESNSLVASVDNPFPADGGAEAENLTDAATRGTRRMFQVERAYRAEDYEILARQASGRVARAHCLPPRTAEVPLAHTPLRPPTSDIDGALKTQGNTHKNAQDQSLHSAFLAPLRLIILPRSSPPAAATPDASAGLATEGPGFSQKLLPSEELLDRVRHYLEKRRTLNVVLEVTGPRYSAFSLRVSLYLKGRLSPGTEEDLNQRLRRYLHPLTGGEDGRGWPLGGAVRRNGLFQVLSSCPQVLSVLEVQLLDRHGNPLEGTLQLEDDQLPYLTGVRVEVATLR